MECQTKYYEERKYTFGLKKLKGKIWNIASG